MRSGNAAARSAGGPPETLPPGVRRTYPAPPERDPPEPDGVEETLRRRAVKEEPSDCGCSFDKASVVQRGHGPNETGQAPGPTHGGPVPDPGNGQPALPGEGRQNLALEKPLEGAGVWCCEEVRRGACHLRRRRRGRVSPGTESLTSDQPILVPLLTEVFCMIPPCFQSQLVRGHPFHYIGPCWSS